MSLYESRGNLQKSLKDLIHKWQIVKAEWNDEQADSIEQEVLYPLERDVRTAGEAMDLMKGLVTSARRDCQQS